MEKLLLVCFILINCFCCTYRKDANEVKRPMSKYDSIVDYFKIRQKISLEVGITKIFVLTEKGCMSCNKKFMELVEENISNKSALILIGTDGSYLDVSKFTPSKRILVDQSLIETGYTVLHESKVIYLRNKSIDSIVTIDARQIQRQFEFIRSKN